MKTLFSVFILVSLSTTSQAGSFFAPPSKSSKSTSSSGGNTTQSAPVVSNPTPAPVVPQQPNADFDSSKLWTIDVFGLVSTPVGTSVDDRFTSFRELMKERNPVDSSHSSDHCDVNLEGSNKFADRVAYEVDLHMNEMQGAIGSIASYYSMSSNEKSYYPVSLIKHPMCNVTSSTLSQTISKVPAASTIAKANEFADRYNKYRSEALEGNQESFVKLQKLWSRMMMCLSYTESLTSANTSSSNNVADSVAPSGYRRPAGVLFYNDPWQDAASRLNIGLFQFTPNSGGNVASCIKQWNQVYPSCQIAPNANQSEMIRALGSSLQTFNSFCGVNKVIQTFTVQVNTTSSSKTHPYNKTSSGLKAPADRCVSLHFQAGKAYNHFGPFQNSTGSNLNEMLTCTLAGIE